MNKSKFLSDSRFCQLSASDIACAGGMPDIAIARLLNDDSDTSFDAVLDTDGETVWTAATNEAGEQIKEDDGWGLLPKIESESLADYA